MAWEVKNVLIPENVRLYQLCLVDVFLNIIKGILFNGSEITGGWRITLIQFTRLVEALETRNFW
jgi:hypothetical protein